MERQDLQGAARCAVLTDGADRWLTGLLEAATGGDLSRIALVAVGGYGRRELCPGSDLDVVLVHDGRRDISTVADAVWYPVWDGGARVDHAVRQRAEMLKAATDDLRVQLGLLDGRVVAGDAALAEPVLAEAADLWRRRAAVWAPVLAAQAEERRAAAGDLAFLLEPDLKESHGGLRDADVVRALVQGIPPLAEQLEVAALPPARNRLLDVRVELQALESSSSDRLLLQAQDDVARALGVGDADQLMAEVAAAGRAVASVAEELWVRLARWTAPPPRRRRWRRAGGQVVDASPSRTRVEPGVALSGGPGQGPAEVELDPDTADLADVTLPVRLAAVAAERGLPLDRHALDTLSAAPPPVPDPWPDELRSAFVRVLAAGEPAIAAVEALDRHGLLVLLLPEWEAVRNRPQRNAYHRYTVDRHLLQAAANAAPLALGSPRPDLLLLGTLLHDIGKGFPGDHTEVGQELVARIGHRMGLPPADVDTLVTMVRLHLLLPDAATRRDLDDPATVQAVAEAVGDATTLSLLAALTEADSLATGPSAWGPWKAGLVAELVSRSRAVLAGEAPPTGPVDTVTDRHRHLMTQARRLGRSVLVAEGDEVTVVAEDRPGLLATAAGVLALFGLDVRSADVTGADGFAVERFVVEPARGRWPDWTRVADDLEAALRGSLPLERRLAERADAYERSRRPTLARPVATRVTIDNEASSTATVVEVRTADGIGVLHRLTRAVFASGLDVVSARVSTLGAEVVDAFYVIDPATGDKVRDPGRRRALEQALGEAASPGPGSPTSSGGSPTSSDSPTSSGGGPTSSGDSGTSSGSPTSSDSAERHGDAASGSQPGAGC